MSLLNNITKKIVQYYGKYFNQFVTLQFNSNSDSENCKDKDRLDFFVVAFNNFYFIKYQYEFIKKNVVGNYSYFVIDNSTKNDVSFQIKDFCIQNNINYYKVKVKIPFTSNSLNHGCVLNWIYKNLISVRKNNFAFLDHDIFPVKKYCVENIFKDYKIIGYKNVNETGKYLIWPGLFFCEYSFIKDFKVNFIPHKGLDTGGMMYYNLYYFLDESKIKILNKNTININNRNAIDTQSLQQNFIELYDDNSWFHAIGGAEWTNLCGKNQLVYDMLEKYLENT